GGRDRPDPHHQHGPQERGSRPRDPHEEAGEDGAAQPGAYRPEERTQRGYRQDGQDRKMLARQGEDVRASGRLEGIGLLLAEAVPDSEDQGLHQAGRAPPYPGEGLPAGLPYSASRPVDPP